jgi:glutamate-1-semialdehyde 2,1-aminomutase
VARGGAQRRFRVKPDLTCLGKVIGGGLPAAAYGGRRDLMDRIAPQGDIYQAGTLSGNPLAMAAGLETLDRLEATGVYERLGETAQRLADGFQAAADAAGVPLSTNAVGGMWGFFFHPGPVRDFADAQAANIDQFRCFFAGMLKRGIYLAPSAFEAAFVSLSHSKRDVAKTLEAASESMQEVARMR